MTNRDNDEGGPVRLLICDDHKLLTDALSIVANSDDGVTLVAPAFNDPEDAVAAVGEHRPDVALMDVSFEGHDLTGIDATRLIKDASPETSVVIVTGQDEERLLVEAVEAGASGFLRKSEAVDRVLDVVKAAARGEVLVDPAVLARVLGQVARAREAQTDADRRIADLTPRELEILAVLAEGGRNEDVAAALHISPQTLQTHVHNILTKLGVRSKLEAVVFAVKRGVIEI